MFYPLISHPATASITELWNIASEKSVQHPNRRPIIIFKGYRIGPWIGLSTEYHGLLLKHSNHLQRCAVFYWKSSTVAEDFSSYVLKGGGVAFVDLKSFLASVTKDEIGLVG